MGSCCTASAGHTGTAHYAPVLSTRCGPAATALELLDWLDQHGIPLGKLTQPELETWLEERPEKRRERNR
jgi:hypothetical protein